MLLAHDIDLLFIGSILSCPRTSIEVAPGQGPKGSYKIRVWGPSQKRKSKNNVEETRKDVVLCGPHMLFYSETGAPV